MKTKLCDVNPAALEKLPEHTGDKSGVGVHYVDAYIKPMNLKLPDGTPVKCKRRGLEIVFPPGRKKGEDLLRRRGPGPRPLVRLAHLLPHRLPPPRGPRCPLDPRVPSPRRTPQQHT